MRDAASVEDFSEGNLRYLREKYAIGFITLYELEIGLDSVLAGGPVNVPQREAHALRGCRLCLGMDRLELNAGAVA